MRSWLRCPRLRPQQIARQSRTIRDRGLTTCRGRKSCLHSGSRPKWPAWRNRRRLSPSAWATFCTAQLLSRETRYRVVEQIDSCSRREPRAACKRSEGHGSREKRRRKLKLKSLKRFKKLKSICLRCQLASNYLHRV